MIPLSVHCRGKSDDAVRRDALGRKVTAVIMAKKKVKDAARDLLGDFLGEHSLELFNIEFVKEGRDRYLRVYIDKPEESGEYVSIDECELVSRYLSDPAGRNGSHRGQLLSGGVLPGSGPSSSEGFGLCALRGQDGGRQSVQRCRRPEADLRRACLC